MTANEEVTKSVLVVEDQELLLDVVKTILERHGLHVLTALDGQEAVNVFSEHHEQIGVVLMDLGLPKIDGWDAYLRMRIIQPGVKAIIASGFVDPSLKDKMSAEGALDFVQKPYRTEELVEKIRHSM